jgi:8-oxo-dGTP diphosphatase
MPRVEITNMVMIQDKTTGKVLIQERTKSWKGLAFPGGHVDEGESIVDSAIREIKEETGLDIKNLKSCGIFHWSNNETFDRYIVFLYKTTDFEGELITEMEEGKNFWISIDELKERPTANTFHNYLPMFLEDGFNEAFGLWNEDEPWEFVDIVYK